MTEIPEHLLKRAEEARSKAKFGGSGPVPSSTPDPFDREASKIPAHLLERAAQARAKAASKETSTAKIELPPHAVLKGYVIAFLHDLPKGTKYYLYPDLMDDPGASAWTRGESNVDERRSNEVVIVESWPQEAS